MLRVMLLGDGANTKDEESLPRASDSRTSISEGDDAAMVVDLGRSFVRAFPGERRSVEDATVLLRVR